MGDASLADAALRSKVHDGRVIRQCLQTEVVEGELAAAAEPRHVNGDGDGRCRLDLKLHRAFTPRPAHTIVGTLGKGDGSTAEVLPALTHLDGGRRSGRVGIVCLVAVGKLVLADRQCRCRGLADARRAVAPALALKESIGAIGNGCLTEIVVGKTVGGDEELLVGARGGPTCDGSHIPSAQAVARLCLAHAVGAGRGIGFETGVLKISGGDVALRLRGNGAQGSSQ